MVDPRNLFPRLPALKLFIDGKSVEPVEGGSIPVMNPATGEKICDAPAASAKDVAKAHALAKRIKAGVVWINCFNEFDDAAPFGGYEQSGWGSDLSPHALHGFLNVKAVWTKLPEV